MSNALTQSRNEVATGAGAVDPYLAAAAADGGNATYMKFNGNSGEYTVGQEADEIPEGTKLAVNMLNFKQGWICWKDGAVAEEKMYFVSRGEIIPQEHELTDHGPYIKTETQNDGWSAQRSVELQSLADGETYIFKTSSKSAYRALGTLLKDYGRQYKTHPGELPVAQLGTGSFVPKNKQFGKKYTPELKIVEWIKQSELEAKFQGDDEGAYETGGEQAQLPAPTSETAAPAASTPAATAPAAAAEPAKAAAAPAATAPAAEAPAKAAEPAKAEAAPAAKAEPAAAPAGEKPVPAQRGARRRAF